MNDSRRVPPDELLEFAEPYALHALDPQERTGVDAARNAATPDTRDRFDAVVQDVRETMAAHARGYPELPASGTFDVVVGRLVSESATPMRSGRARYRRVLQAAVAAAVLVVAVAGGVVLGHATRGEQPGPSAPAVDAVLAAPDARTAQARVGEATISLVYSLRYNSAVVLMNDVPPPKEGTVYQMWLMDANGAARSRGVMAAADVRPTTTAALPGIDGATSFGITIEQPGGAQAPTRDRIVATLPIVR
ncbi:anti-sigma factor [Tsukamurella sp. 8F]|uniref:anti-sigma factor n=1 Tax=Tsukamurella sp. 8F TaxID=3031961 RepID=UPI0023B8B84B|nr:anti-sigma factor [Tsukamurella sp. 8F]MDF0586122.1 anti-sigma factor [Tsukamurella sp. 8F]